LTSALGSATNVPPPKIDWDQQPTAVTVLSSAQEENVGSEVGRKFSFHLPILKSSDICMFSFPKQILRVKMTGYQDCMFSSSKVCHSPVDYENNLITDLFLFSVGSQRIWCQLSDANAPRSK
jgi:hypothetical protein